MPDTPGILWPKFEDQRVALMLAFLLVHSHEVIDLEEIAFALLNELRGRYSDYLQERYGINDHDIMETIEIMNAIVEKRGFLLGGKKLII